MARKAGASEAKASEAKASEAPERRRAKPETIVWLNRLGGLLRLAPDHEGAAERISIYADKVEADIGVRPVTLLNVQQLLAEIRGL
jgi:hypothetical protein